jgi:chromosome segregation ATPase
MDSELRVASVELNTLEKNHNNEYETKKIYLGQLVKQVADFEKEKSKKKASREKYKEKLINLRSKKKHLMKTMKSIEEEIQNNNDIMKLKDECNELKLWGFLGFSSLFLNFKNNSTEDNLRKVNEQKMKILSELSKEEKEINDKIDEKEDKLDDKKDDIKYISKQISKTEILVKNLGHEITNIKNLVKELNLVTLKFSTSITNVYMLKFSIEIDEMLNIIDLKGFIAELLELQRSFLQIKASIQTNKSLYS